MTANDFAELEDLLNTAPFFQNGHTVLAKASRVLKKPAAGQAMKRAAIYATNRDIFKKYLTSKLSPTAKNSQPQAQVKKRTDSQAQDSKAPNLLSKSEQEKLISEIYDNLEKWKTSRDHFLEYDKAHPEEIVILPVDTKEEVSEPEPVASDPSPSDVQNIKDEIAEELEMEEKIEETISKQSSPPQEDTPPESPIPTEEIMGIAEEIKNEVAREEEQKGDEEENKKSADKGPEVEPLQSVDPSSIYNFGSAPVAEEPPTDTSKGEPEVESSDVISTEELSAIVDKTDELKEEEKKEGPEIEPLTENLGHGDIDIDDGIQELDPKISAGKDEADELEIEEVDEVSTEPDTEKEDKDAPEIESIDDIDISEIGLPGEEPEIKNTEQPANEKSNLEEIENAETKSSVDEDIEEEEEEDETALESTGHVEDEIKIDIQIDDEKSTEETEAELSKLDAEKQELKLQPGQFSRSKKFRVSVLTKPIQFKKQGKKVQLLTAESRREKAAKAEEVKEKISSAIKSNKSAKAAPNKAKTKKATTTKKAESKATAKKSAAAKKKTTAKSSTVAKKKAATKTKPETKSTAKKTPAPKPTAKKTTAKKSTTKKKSDDASDKKKKS